MNNSNESRQTKQLVEIVPREPKPEQITAVIDSREQTPLDLNPLQTAVGTLATGDYSIVGLESVIAVERKSLSDLLSCIGTERERFEREVLRLLAYPHRALVIESTWTEIAAGDWRSRIHPSAAIGSLLGWSAMGLPIVMGGDHETCSYYTAKFLFIAARRRWREARALVESGTQKAAEGKEA